MLAFQVPFTAAAGNIGCFFWSHDIGGHFGARAEETIARWVQFGALSAALRVHSARSPALDRRPWTCERRFVDAMRRAYDLRSRLMPYIWTSVRACHERMLPLLRPMYLHHPQRERAYRTPWQYTLGNDVLVAPIVAPGLGTGCVATQYVWFPPSDGEGAAGAGWHNLLTGEHHDPGEEAIVSADMDHVPVFVRSGVLLPEQPSTHRMATEPLTTLVLRVFPGKPGQFCESMLYEDDGVTRAHERGAFSVTPLTARWSRSNQEEDALVLEATIGPASGSFAGQNAERAIHVSLGAVGRVLGATINGRDAEWSFDAESAGGSAIVRTAPADIRRPITIRVSVEPVDQRALAHRERHRNIAAALGHEFASVQLREVLISECSCASQGTTDRKSRLLSIGAGIGVVSEDHSLRFVDTLGWIESGEVDAEILDRIGRAETVLSKARLKLEPSRESGHGRVAGASSGHAGSVGDRPSCSACGPVWIPRTRRAPSSSSTSSIQSSRRSRSSL